MVFPFIKINLPECSRNVSFCPYIRLRSDSLGIDGNHKNKQKWAWTKHYSWDLLG